MKVKNPHKFYKGVFYWYSYKNGEWYCDLYDFPEDNPFRTQKEVKIYISDYIDNLEHENKHGTD